MDKSNMAAQVSNDLLQCSICLSCFREPKIPNCLHSFCLACLQELKQQSSTNTLCPLCRKETATEDAADLPDNLSLSALVEERIIQKQLQEGQGSEIKCQACDEENPAVSRCMDCDNFLCQECQKAHQRLTAMKSHKIYTVAQLRSGDIAYRSKLRDYIPKCVRHPDQNLNLYCITCQRLVCTTCSVLLVQRHKSEEHSFMDLTEALDKCKEDIAEQTAKVKMIQTSFSNAAKKTDDESIEQLRNKYSETKKKISERAEEEVAKIRVEERKLKQELEKIYKDRLKTFESTRAANSQEEAKVEHKLDQVKGLMAQASCYEILDLQQKLLQNLRELELTCRQPLKTSKRAYFMDFEEGDSSLGTLVLEDEPKLKLKGCQNAPKQTASTCAPCIPKFENAEEDVIQATRKKPIHASKKVLHEQQKGLVSGKWPAQKPDKLPKNSKMEDRWSFGSLMPKGQPKSESMAEVSASVQPEELDHFEQWVFTKHIETYGPEQTKFTCAYDVGAFSDNEIVIVDTKCKRLIRTLLTSDPQSNEVSSILEIKGLADPHYITINKDDQLIVSCGKPTVMTFNREYKLLHQFIIGRGGKGGPTCLAVDDKNQIAVGYKYKKQIFLHSPKGTFLKVIHATMIDSHLTIHKQRLIYTNYWNKMLYAQEYDGTMVFSVNVPSDSLGYWGPNGVCCDGNGSIYVAVRGNGSTGPSDEIIRFSPDGKHLGSAITGCGLPWGITLTRDNNNLVVAAKNSINIFNRAYYV